MKRKDSFDLFLTGARGVQWTQNAIDEFMESVETEMDDIEDELSREAGWEEKSETIDTKEVGVVGIESKGDNNYVMTLDVSEYLPLRDFEVISTLNNGVLKVEFISLDE